MPMRRHKRIKEEAELNVTSFMNLMIVLVPVLLMNMVFSQLAVLDLRPLLSHSLGQQMKSLIPSVILLLPHNRKTKESGFVAS